MIAYYLTHPQVAIDPLVPVPEWSLSATGRQRIGAALDKPWFKTIRRIVSSQERKAVETATLIGNALGLAVEQHEGMGENDRSATGFIPPEKFEAAADAFFAEPASSYRGWEPAADAQMRIVGAVEKALNGEAVDSPVLLVGHGAVGTLLKCHLAGLPIARSQDQPSGGGNLFAFRISDHKLLCDWTEIERFQGIADA